MNKVPSALLAASIVVMLSPFHTAFEAGCAVFATIYAFIAVLLFPTGKDER